MKYIIAIAILVTIAYNTLALPELKTAASSIEYAYTGVK